MRDANGVPTPFPIALVDRIYSEESGGTLWVWPPPLSNRGTRRDCPGEFSGTLPVPESGGAITSVGFAAFDGAGCPGGESHCEWGFAIFFNATGFADQTYAFNITSVR